ncbi:VOC family protein [Rhizobiaceae bacterium n13]|uniref:VOC family protein n=1 Tax=Ferirhizobium litorale TaxID=2927786 RepID=A0AAE3QF61_9HYPH|nr:VOC family protein [Fererhizobium litorale]MDI7862326.1 VOC family protein [Fererhizobium litorale]MDI7922400.1 VOC family protein [Fererhizobium litorale]
MTEATKTPLRIGKVTLTVHDLARVSDYYQQVLGLHRLSAEGDHVTLGAGNTVLLQLDRDASARDRSPHDAGLFHTAFLLPDRADLGRWAKRAVEQKLRILGASDHGVSEAIYLADPEGNGIEIYADRPRSEWKWQDGRVDMPTHELDVGDLIATAADTSWKTAPDGTSIGHVHLQVGNIPKAEEFYGGVLGLDITCRYPGGSFYSSGGYHHHLATNIWKSRDAAPRKEPTTGLADVEIVADDPALVERAVERAHNALLVADHRGSDLRIHDPWGTHITLATRDLSPRVSP